MWSCQFASWHEGNKDVVKLLQEYSEVIDINITDQSGHDIQVPEDIKTLINMHLMTVQK